MLLFYILNQTYINITFQYNITDTAIPYILNCSTIYIKLQYQLYGTAVPVI